MVRSVSAAARSEARRSATQAAVHAWLETDPQRGESLAYAPPAAGDPALPPLVARLDAAQVAAQIAHWRAASAPLDALFRQGVAPTAALRRFGLTHWSTGNPRAASQIFAVAAALNPDSAELWLDLAFTLHGAGDAVGARPAFERALALDSNPARAWVGLALAAKQLDDKPAAESAFRAALHRDAKNVDAAFGLGLLCFEQRRYAEAATFWRLAIALGCQNAVILAGLGQALFCAGDFVGAARALAEHVARGPAEPNVLRRYALSRFLEAIIAGDIEAAFAAYAEAAGAHAEEAQTVTLTALQMLGAFGHRDAALRLGRACGAATASDPVTRYAFAAIAEEKRDRAPRDYIVAHFDRFAETFDRQLVEVLGYDVPSKLIRLIEATGKTLPRALDLGCGTGLAGPLLKPGRTRLVGVDLSPRMLAKAAERKIYDRLVEADIVEFLDSATEQFDLVFAADAVIYLGDLDGFLAGAAQRLPAGGVVAFNVETAWGAPFRLQASGRFAHDVAALRDQAAPRFALRAAEPTVLRLEANAPVHGSLVVLERRDG